MYTIILHNTNENRSVINVKLIDFIIEKKERKNERKEKRFIAGL